MKLQEGTRFRKQQVINQEELNKAVEELENLQHENQEKYPEKFSELVRDMKLKARIQ